MAVEAAGDMVTGGMIARAMEPGHGETTASGHGACANCGTALAGPFCHACGQNSHVHRSLGGIGHEIAHGVFHFEGKIWRTLPLLAIKPGELTRRYIHGERARFISPLALFLFAVFLTFAVFEAVGGPVHMGEGLSSSFDIKREIGEQSEAVRRLEAERGVAQAAGRPFDRLDERLGQARKDLDGMRNAARYMDGDATTLDGDPFQVATGSPELDAHAREAIKNPRLLLYKLQTSAYKYSWALILLSLPWMWLVFPFRRDLHIYDHAVFVTYSLASLMLLIVLASFGVAAGVNGSWLLLLFPIHMFLQLKGAYRLGRWGAGWRTLVLLVAAALTLTLFAAGLLALGLLA